MRRSFDFADPWSLSQPLMLWRRMHCLLSKEALFVSGESAHLQHLQHLHCLFRLIISRNSQYGSPFSRCYFKSLVYPKWCVFKLFSFHVSSFSSLLISLFVDPCHDAFLVLYIWSPLTCSPHLCAEVASFVASFAVQQPPFSCAHFPIPGGLHPASLHSK